MVRGLGIALVSSVALAATGCSLVLDFSDSQIPVDAPIDSPFTDEECGYKEPNDGLATAAPITPGETGPAAICEADPEDSDFYKFTVSDGATEVRVAIDFMNRADGDLDLRLLDGAGMMIAQSRGVGNGEAITCPGMSPGCPTLAAGEYVFQVFPALPGATNKYTIALAITTP